MRLLMTADTVGGVWNYALNLAAGLALYGVETNLVTFGPGASPDQRAAAGAVVGLRLVETGLGVEWLASSRELADSALRVAELANVHAADVVQLNSPVLAALAEFAVPVVGVCHSCLASWWRAMRGDAAMPADFAWRTALLRQAYGACDMLVAPSAAFAAVTDSLYGARPVVVANGSQVMAGPHPDRRDGILTAGRLWDEAKNFATLDEAAGMLDQPVKAAGPLRMEGAHVACRHAVSLGRVSSAVLQFHMRETTIFASMALYEPFGLSVLEAALNGCALVLSDIPSFREIWDGAALFVPARDAGAAAEALRGLLASPGRQADFAAAAQKRAARYSVATMAAGMAALYRVLREKAAVAA